MTLFSSARSAARTGFRQSLLRRTALGGVLLIVAHAGGAAAAPTLAGVPAQVAHAPVITAPNANSTTVALKQSRTLIDWSSFNLTQGQQVDFVFQRNSWIVLNRINTAARIDGTVLGCVSSCGAGGAIGGNVWFYSPAGVIFGPHAHVNVGGLLATTSPLLSEAGFLDSGNFSFKFGGGSPDARVVVQSGAQLNALGSLALIAPSVLTEAGSSIDAGGTALYGAAQNYVIHFDETVGNGLNLLDFEVPASALTDGTISSTPLTLGGETAAGKVLIASVSRPSVVRAVISLNGMVTASSASDAGGGDILLNASGGPAAVLIGGDLRASHGVSLQASNGGSITVAGAVSAASAGGAGGTISIGGAGTGAVDLASGARLDASSTGAGDKGGSVVLTAGAVQVDGAISAIGPAGGGKILVGGGAQGRDAQVANAATTTVGSGAVLDASATGRGDGGQVVVWSDHVTSFQGAILGRSGASGGAGGAAEVSSAGYLSYAGTADLRAADGSAGRLLLDPSELIVIPTGGSGTVSGGANPAASAASSTIGADTIDTALLTADVTITTHMSTTGGNGVIEFNGGAGPLIFANTSSTSRTLSFIPEQGFVFDTGLATKGPINLTLNAGTSPVSLPNGGLAVTDGDLTVIGSNLVLPGNIAAPHVTLTASGSIDQTGGTITTGKLLGSSGGATSLPDANAVGSLQNFTAGGGLALTNAADISADTVSAGSGALNLTTTSGTLTVNGVSAGTGVNLTAAGNLNLVGDVAGQTATFSAGGAIDQVGGVITATTLSASAVNGISLTDSNAVTNLGGLASTSSGGIAFAGSGDITLSGDINAAGQSVSLVAPGGSINQASGAIIANFLTVAANGAVSLTDANTVSIVGGLIGGSTGNVSFVDSASFTLTGDVAAVGQTASLVSTGGSITQTGGVITASSFSASAASGLSLGGQNEIPTVTSLSSGAGGLSFNDNQTVTIAAITLGGGDMSLSTTAGDLNLTSAVSSPGALSLSAANAVNVVSASAVGDYSVTGAVISTPALQPTLTGPASNLSIDFTNTIGSTNLFNTALSAPGSVTVVVHDSDLEIGSITAGAGVTLSSPGSISEGEGGSISGATLTASAVTGLDLSGSNMISTVTSLSNTQSGGLYFSDGQSVTIGSVTEGGNGYVSLSTQSGDLTLTTPLTGAGQVYLRAANNLTVDGITTPGYVTLSAGGALTETAGASISLGGSYSASATTMDAAVEQPVFTSGSFGSLSLNFSQTGGLTDLTGVPLSAPQSVSVTANAEALKVDSITAGSSVTLYSGGVLSAASGAQINLASAYYYGSYSATAVSVDLTNPVVVQPTFAASALGGSLSLNFTQSGGTINLTGAPLSAPGSVTVSASGAGLTVDSIAAGNSISLSSGGVLTTVAPITAGQYASFSSSGNMSVDSISALNVTLSSGGVLSAASGAAIDVLYGYSATAMTIDPTNPVVLQPTFMPGSTGNLSLTFTQSNGTTDLSGTPLSAPGSVSVSLASSDSNENLTVGSITAGSGVSLYTGSYVTNGGVLTTGAINAGGSVSLSTGYYFYSGGGAISAGPITAGGGVTASSGAYSTSAFTFGSINAGGGVSLNTGVYYGGALTTGAINAAGQVTLYTGYYSNGALTTGPITAGSGVSLTAGAYSTGVLTVDSITAGSDVFLDAGGALQAVVSGLPVTIKTGGRYGATGSTIDPTLFQPTFTGTTGNLSLTFNGTGGVDLTGHPLSAPGSISVSAHNENLTVDLLTAASSANGNITLSAGGALMSADVASPSLGGSYSATGATIATLLFQPMFAMGSVGSLNLDFTGSGGGDLTGFHLIAPGSVSVSAPSGNLTVDSITAAGNVTLDAGLALQTPVSTPVTISVGGSYSATGSTIASSLFEPAFAGSAGDLSLTFNGSGGANLTGFALSAPGSVSVSAPSENLTVGSINASADVSLDAGLALAAASGATINLFGNYSATAQTISPVNPVVLQPTFTAGSLGNLSLTFYQSGSVIDLTGTSLTAPGSVFINAYYEGLTVDSITAGSGISLNTGGALQASTSGPPVSMTLGGNYSATAVTIDPTLLQPTFTMGSSGSLSLAFNQSGATVDLTGHPLSAPGSISISTNGTSENLTVDTLTAGGNVSVSTYYYDTGTLTAGAVSAAGNVSLSTGSYYGGALTAGSIVAGGQVSLSTGYYSGGALTVGPITAGSGVNLLAGLYSSGVITVSSITANGGVTLDAGGALMASTTGAPVTISLGGSYSATGVTIDPILYQPIFGMGSSGSLSLGFRQTGSAIDLTGHPLTAPGSISLSSSENLTIDSLTATGQLSLSASGALNEAGGAVITGNTLTASATMGIVLNGANAVQFIQGLSNSSVGGISFTNQGNVILNYYYSPVSAPGQAVNLVSNTGSISDGYTYYYYYPSIVADTFTASAATGINLTRYNQVNKLGPISNSTSGGINFTDTYNLALVGDVSAPGQTVNLTSIYGGLSQTGGVITANILNATASYGIAFNDANAVAMLGTLTNAYSGGISFTNGGDLVLSGDLTANGQTVNLVSNTGAVTEGSVTTIFADTVTGSAATGFHLDSSNEVSHLGAISNTGSGGISFTNDGDLNLTGDIGADGQTVTLVSLNGALSQGLGSVSAGTLNLSAVTGIDLSGPNAATQLGTISTTSGDIAFVNEGDVTLTGNINAAGQNVSLRSNSGALGQFGGVITADTLRASGATGLSLTSANQVTTLGVLDNGAFGGIAYTSAGGIALSVDLNGFGEAVSLTAQSGAVTQSGGQILTAGTLNVSATTGVTLGDANAVTHLGAVSNTAGGVSLNDTVNLSLTGDLQASGQTVGLTGGASVSELGGAVTASTLDVTAVDGIAFNNLSGAFGPMANSTAGGVSLSNSSGDLQLTADISAPGQDVSLDSKNGAISQTGGIITAGALSASAATGVTLGDANQVTALGIVTNMTSGGVAITSVGGIDVSQVIDAPGQTVSLTSSTGALTQSSGLIIASTLNASAVTGITLAGGNLITNLGTLNNTTMGGISYVSAGDPFLTGNISAPGQVVTLVSSTGSFTQNAGVITADTLNVSALTGITLNDANVVANVGVLSNTGSGGISFTNAGDFSVVGAVTAPGQAVALTSTSGSITQSAGAVTADSVSLTTGKSITLKGNVSAVGTLSLTVNGGDITQSGGAVSAQNVNLSASGAVNLVDVSASNQTTIIASTLSLTPATPTGNALQAPTLTIESRTGLIDLGDNLTDPGFTGMTLTGATLKALNTDSISFYAGYFNPTARLTDLAPQAAVAIKVGDVSTDFKGLSNLPGGATAYLYAGPTSTISVLGSITSGTPGLGNIVIGDRIADAWTPKTIAISGSIGASGTTLAPLNSIELNATRDVLLGDSQFQTAIANAEQSGQTSFINIKAGEPAGVTGTGNGALFIGSNTLTLRAQSVIASQNTGATGDFAGIDLVNGKAASTVLTLGTTLATTSRGTPVIIDIFGTLKDATGMAITGMDLAPSTGIALEAPLAITDFYRANGCVIGQTGVCNVLTVQTLPTKLIQGVILSASADSDAATESAAVARVYAQTMLISTKIVTPVGDPTITGVGNEEIWRGPTCDPNGGTPCP